MLATVRAMDDQEAMLKAVDQENIANEKFVDGWDDRLEETCDLLKQVTLFVDDWIFDMQWIKPLIAKFARYFIGKHQLRIPGRNLNWAPIENPARYHP